ncbi:hypothetical protein RCL1_008358 [Eukaryota sp. TZLM3-RCL]
MVAEAVTKVYIGGVPDNISVAELNEKLSEYKGHQVVTLRNNPERRFKGLNFAIVSLPSDETAQLMKTHLSGATWAPNTPLVVEDARPQRPRRPPMRRGRFQNNRKPRAPRTTEEPQEGTAPVPQRHGRFNFRQHAYSRRVQRLNQTEPKTVRTENDGTSVFVQNLPFSFGEEELRAFATENSLNIESVKVLTVRTFNRRTNALEVHSMGKGFMKFQTAELAQDFITKYNKQEIGGRVAFVSLARSGPRQRIEA